MASLATPAPNAQHCVEHRNKGCRAEVNDFPADELAPSALPTPWGRWCPELPRGWSRSPGGGSGRGGVGLQEAGPHLLLVLT